MFFSGNHSKVGVSSGFQVGRNLPDFSMFPSDRYEQMKNRFWGGSLAQFADESPQIPQISKTFIPTKSCDFGVLSRIWGKLSLRPWNHATPNPTRSWFLGLVVSSKMPRTYKILAWWKKKVCKICEDARCSFTLGMNSNVPISCICVCVKVTKKQAQNCEFGPQNSGPQTKTCTNIFGHQTNMAHIAV